MSTKLERDLAFNSYIETIGKLDPASESYGEACIALCQAEQTFILNELLNEITEIKEVLREMNKEGTR